MAPVKFVVVSSMAVLIQSCTYRALSPLATDASTQDGGPLTDRPEDALDAVHSQGKDAGLGDRDETLAERQPWVLPPGPAPSDPAVEAAYWSGGGCVATQSGALWCWGYAFPGGGLTEQFLRPRRVEGIPPIRALDGGLYRYEALDREGRVWSWNYSGLPCQQSCQTCYLGGLILQMHAPLAARSIASEGWVIFEDGSCRRLASRLSDPDGCSWQMDWREGVVAFDVLGSLHCAVMSSGRLECLNREPNRYGNINYGGRFYHHFPATPSAYPGLSDVVDFAFHGTLGNGQCALLRSGEVRCWGENRCGEAGSQDGIDQPCNPDNPGDRGCYPTPELVTGIQDAVRLIPHGRGACVLRRDGTVWCWGQVPRGQWGIFSGARFDHPLYSDLRAGCLRGPAPIEGLRDVVDFSLSGESWCAVIRGGRVFCYGYVPGDGTSGAPSWPPREVHWGP